MALLAMIAEGKDTFNARLMLKAIGFKWNGKRWYLLDPRLPMNQESIRNTTRTFRKEGFDNIDFRLIREEYINDDPVGEQR